MKFVYLIVILMAGITANSHAQNGGEIIKHFNSADQESLAVTISPLRLKEYVALKYIDAETASDFPLGNFCNENYLVSETPVGLKKLLLPILTVLSESKLTIISYQWLSIGYALLFLAMGCFNYQTRK
jgi:hypothetical protein